MYEALISRFQRHFERCLASCHRPSVFQDDAVIRQENCQEKENNRYFRGSNRDALQNRGTSEDRNTCYKSIGSISHPLKKHATRSTTRQIPHLCVCELDQSLDDASTAQCVSRGCRVGPAVAREQNGRRQPLLYTEVVCANRLHQRAARVLGDGLGHLSTKKVCGSEHSLSAQLLSRA